MIVLDTEPVSDELLALADAIVIIGTTLDSVQRAQAYSRSGSEMAERTLLSAGSSILQRVMGRLTTRLHALGGEGW